MDSRNKIHPVKTNQCQEIDNNTDNDITPNSLIKKMTE